MDRPRVYLAAPWIYKSSALIAQNAFEQAGFEVTSHWIKYHPDTVNDGILSAQAMADLSDVRRAQIFVLLNYTKSEGKATELGFAYALERPLILVGPRDGNIFYHLPAIVRVMTVHDAIQSAKTIAQSL